MPKKLEYAVTPTANSDAEYYRNKEKAIKAAKAYAKQTKETCYIDVNDLTLDDRLDYWYTVSPEGVVKKH